jgi:hypothetical protein
MNTRVATRVDAHAHETKVGSTIGYVLSLMVLAFGGVLTLLWIGFLSWVLLSMGLLLLP